VKILAAVALCASVAGAQTTDLRLLDYHTVVPAGWQSRAPSSTSRLAEFVLPQAAAGSGEVIVFFFGPNQQPNVDANLARWKGQFSHPDGSPIIETVTRDSSGAFPLVFAEYEGTYRRGIGAGSADSVRNDQRLIASIVPTPKGVLYVQMFGTAARIADERKTFMAFVKAIH
jgi:hypothetical protein